ncbi:MAG: class I fructose-bisphosphate aldolase [Chloroflexota bacterium]|mgnify:CR=1 FL=1|nr:class I fructose-bisphosphate aldolase [Chloroflexota bacterium]MQG04576.1 class I fructose-bisphosphate aldolase [SAR202 cluster bacterium]|tara:strand:- start:16 stop:936 length:921 start_codon:yes stop_codon:yes gene_type:complete
MNATDRVNEILSWYQHENGGTLGNIERLLMSGYLSGTGKLVILPVDQGFEHGPAKSFAPNPDGYDPEYHFKFGIEAGCNAYAAPLGFLEHGAKKYADKIPLILKLNNSDSLYSGDPTQTMTSTVEDAVRIGCAAVGFSIYPGSNSSPQMYSELREITREAKSKGLAVVVWSYPRGGSLKKEDETAIDVVAYAAHIAAQMGADIIKIKPPSDYISNDEMKAVYEKNNIPISTLSDRVAHCIKSSFNGKRIVIFSGGPAKGTDEIMKEIKEISEGGGFGSIVGRNSFQRPFNEGISLMKDIMNIYKDN